MKHRNLVIGFLLGIALCVACCLTEKIELVLIATVVPFFCAQLWLLKRTRNLLLRLLPVYPIVLLLLAAGYYWFFGTGWDALAALIFGLMSIAPAVGCVLAVLAHRLSLRHKKETNQASPD